VVSLRGGTLGSAEGAAMDDFKFDSIGYWSEVKLDILREYATTFSRILAAQRNPRLYHIYVDGFAGAGVHMGKETRELVPGSPTNALKVVPPFREYHFIDLDERKVAALESLSEGRADVTIHHGWGLQRNASGKGVSTS
jgi:three-Cys-motif partner protein